MLEPDSPVPASLQADRRRFSGFRPAGALESDSPSPGQSPEASPRSSACDHLAVLSGSSSFSIAFELHLTLHCSALHRGEVSATTMASADFWQELPPPDLPG